jgi:iron complex outermembrane receptor protein
MKYNFVACLSGIFCIVHPAFAQNTDALEEITVTAQRKTENIQITPVAVTTISSDRAAELSLDKTADLQRAVPSLNLSYGTANPSTLTVFLRGAGQNAGGYAGSESAVGIYIDDVYHARLTSANVSLDDVANVEVLRGPQGTLYGRNTLTGAIKYTTQKPDGSTFGSTDLTYGSYNKVAGQATFSTAVVPDKWAALVSVSGSHIDGYTNAIALKETRGQDDSMGARIALAYIAAEDFKANFSAYYSYDHNDGVQSIATNLTTLRPLSPGFYDYISPVPNWGLSEEWGSDINLALDLGAVTLKSISAYIGGFDGFTTDVVGGLEPSPGVYTTGFQRTSRTNQEEFSQEFQAVGNLFSDRLEYIAGLYYFHEDAHQVTHDNFFGTVILPDSLHSSTDSYAAFGQLTYHLTDDISAVGGLRYTLEDKGLNGTIQNGVFTRPQILYSVIRGVSFYALTPKFGVNWKINDSLFAYATISRGFESGGFNFLAEANPIALGTPFNPEKVWAYEAGLKSEFLDRHLRVDLAAFDNEFTDLQTNVTTPTGSSLTENAASATVQGIELEATWLATEELEFFSNATRSWDRYDKVDPSTDAYKTGATQLPNVPRWQTQIGFDINESLSRLGMPGAQGNLLFGSDLSFISSKYTGTINSPINKLGARRLIDAFIGYQTDDAKLKFMLSVKNLMDHNYYIANNVFGAYAVRSPGEPRMIDFTVKYKF